MRRANFCCRRRTSGAFIVGLQVTDDDGAAGPGGLVNESRYLFSQVGDEPSPWIQLQSTMKQRRSLTTPMSTRSISRLKMPIGTTRSTIRTPRMQTTRISRPILSVTGSRLDEVGVRFKGNSSFDGTGVKKSIKIDFDEFDEDNDDLTFLGLKKLNLNNNFNDPTMLREKLFYDYASNFVEGVGRAVHTKVYINGEYYGLYTAVEQVDKTFAESRFGDDEDGNLYKGTASDDAVLSDPQADFGSDLTYLGTDQADYEDFYELKTNETANDYSQLIEFIDVLNNTPSGELADAIEPLLDVDRHAGFAGAEQSIRELGFLLGAAHNYYLYDRDDTGQFTHLFWDVNESFGTFTQFVDRGQNPVRARSVLVAGGTPWGLPELQLRTKSDRWRKTCGRLMSTAPSIFVISPKCCEKVSTSPPPPLESTNWPI